jgi:probable HAF family extracellular repeat protein
MYRVLAQDKSLWRALLLGTLLVGMVLVTPASAWALTYTFATIDVPGAGFTQAFGINNAGQIVGVFGDATGRHGFLKTGTTYTPIDVPGASGTEAFGINDMGQVVGAFDDGTGQFSHDFLRTSDAFTTLEDIPGSTSTEVFGINNAGQTVGVFSDGTGIHGFLKAGVAYTPIDVPGAGFTQAYGINNEGQTVGEFFDATGEIHGFLKAGVAYTPIDVPGALYTQAFGINDIGQIVGAFSTGTGIQAFLRTADGFITLNVPGAALTETEAHGINNAGQIVGFFFDASGRTHGFLATPVPTSPPAITVTATPETLWPPNGRMVPVTISGTIKDADADVDASTAAYAVTDEYRQVEPTGNITLRPDGSYSFTIHLQASRNENDKNGRQYSITVSALDNAGNEGSATADVIVPHDQVH